MKRMLSGMQATKNENEILKPEMPEILKSTFWRRNSFLSLS